MLDNLINLVTVLLALSIATERGVELIKGFTSKLSGQRTNPTEERYRQLGIHFLSFVIAFIMVYLSQDYIKALLLPGLDKQSGNIGLPQNAAFALLSTGGSSIWNSILSYLISVKNLKRQDEGTGKKEGNTDLRSTLPLNMSVL